MNLLIITQKVDKQDSNLGFFHDWLLEFAKNFEQIIVICLQKGDYALPDNVKIISLGKDRGANKISLLFNFYKIILRERENYDAVFVHMTPIYVTLGGIFWKLWRKKISLWFTHKSVTIWLYLAKILADVIFTASSSSFRLPGRKVKVVGHGINLKKYFPLENKASGDVIKLISVGRITPVKDYDTLIEALKELRNQGYIFELNIIGAPILETDKEYFENLKRKTVNFGLEKSVSFIGGLAPDKVIPYLQSADIFVHMSRTGSLDKTVLEAMACGLLIVSCNDSTKDVITEYQDYLIYDQGSQEQLAQRIKSLYSLKPEEKTEIKSMLAEIAGRNDLPGLIGKIKQELI